LSGGASGAEVAEDIERIAELFAGYGPVNIRRMFSGAGVFADGLMIALVVDGVVFFKADDRTIPDFERESQSPFQYRSRDGARTLHSYWRMPERLYDEPDELAAWAKRAAACARRAELSKNSGTGRKPTARKKTTSRAR
jgi:DNA transformation protein